MEFRVLYLAALLLPLNIFHLGVKSVLAIQHAQAISARLPPRVPLDEHLLLRLSPRGDAKVGHFTFKQPINHENLTVGHFYQRVMWSSEWWGGPGSPVVMFTPGEASATGFEGYLANYTISGRLAQELKAAVVIVERKLSAP